MRQFFDSLILPLACISFAGFLGTLSIHLAASAHVPWTGSIPDWLFNTMLFTGLSLVLIMVISAWAWSLAEFWDNLSDGMSGLAYTFVFFTIAYAMIISSYGGRYAAVDRIMNPENWTPMIDNWIMTGVLIPLYFVPAMYFWKERPQ